LDCFTETKRSEVMGRIRSTGTTIEHSLYALTRAALPGRWRIDRNVVTLPGTPDVVIPSLRVAIFSDGCFFHACPAHGHRPLSNTAYWLPKLARNVRRDRRASRALRSMGFAVWRFWGHDLTARASDRTRLVLERRIARRLKAVL
jgi:DNA mismatch endonuclease, patch repair protein